ncbi:MAG: MerR family transcriptional regulator, partial [Myxococcota bacterium]
MNERATDGQAEAQDEIPLVKISALARMSGVPTPTIKHYIREGLLPGPVKRTSRNVAFYDGRLAERVKVIKELQQTRFLPLKVIAELLEPAPSSAIREDLEDEQRRQLGQLTPAFQAGADDARTLRSGRLTGPLSRDAVLANTALTADELDMLIRLGLIASDPTALSDDTDKDQITSSDGSPTYSGAALELIEIIDETRRAGMDDLFPMEIIEPYMEEIRRLVRFEIDL